MGLLSFFSSKSIIIGIHGLANKPPKALLEKWWRLSIAEGLANLGFPGRSFRCKLVYWADLIHERPQDPNEKNKKHPLFLDDPYLPGDPAAFDNFTPSALKKRILEKFEQKLDQAFFEEKSFINLERFSNFIVKNLFSDLDYYYHKQCPVARYSHLPAKQAIRDRLIEALQKHRKKKIMLIAHSMGSIIAYDVLTRSVPDITVDTFITIGSPLGLPLILKRIMEEQGIDPKSKMPVPSPENIGSWLNFSDLDDPVAINHNLADDFSKNSRGAGPEDIIVYNNYFINQRRDAHKGFGYLRTPEMSRAIVAFLGDERPSALSRFGKWIGGLFGRR